METTYNGHPNRETYMFHLHVSNDEGLQTLARTTTRRILASTSNPYPHYVGEHVISAICDTLEDAVESDYANHRHLALLAIRDIGSFWRIDEGHVGAAMMRDVAEIDAHA